MAVRIRLKKMGRKHRPFFRVCAMDSRSPRDGRVIEELGTYDPMVRETDARAILKGERIDYWLSVGAKPTPKVGVLIKKYGTDGSHLGEQEAALGRLSTRRTDSISAATKAAEAAAQAAAKAAEEAAAAKAEEEAAAAKAAEEAAAAEAAAAAESTDEAGGEEAAAEEAAAEDGAAEASEEKSE